MLRNFNEMRKVDVLPYCEKREGMLYLNWAKCIDLLHENGAEAVYFVPIPNERTGGSLYYSDVTFTDKNGVTNRAYETRIKVVIDDKEYVMQSPVMNGTNPVKDNSMSQQRVWNSMCRSFVKCVAIHTGLGFNLWLKEEHKPFSNEIPGDEPLATAAQIKTIKSIGQKHKDYNEAKDIKKENTVMTKSEAINVVLGIAEEEIGYLEKKNNSQLDSKTGNAGSANYTKYWRDIKPSYQGQPWCAAFISWCFMKAFGLDNAKKLLKHWPYVYCPTLGALFVKNANPKVGDVVIFKHGDTFTHTGFVTKVAGDRFWTIEGNTSGASGIVANGGGVCQKSYYNSNLPGTKFCTPDYSIVFSADKNETDKTTNPEGGSYMFNPETVKAGDKNTSVLLLQEVLRARGFKGKDGKALKLTWTADANTIYALKAYQKSRKEVLEVDGICGPATWKDLIAM